MRLHHYAGEGVRVVKLRTQHTSVYPWESAATRTASLKSSVLSRTLAIGEGEAAAAASSGQINYALEPARCVLLWTPRAGKRQEEQTAARRIDSSRPLAIQRVGSGGDGRGGTRVGKTGDDGSAYHYICQLLSCGPRTVPPTPDAAVHVALGAGKRRRRRERARLESLRPCRGLLGRAGSNDRGPLEFMVSWARLESDRLIFFTS